jgi:hypothetical protein
LIGGEIAIGVEGDTTSGLDTLVTAETCNCSSDSRVPLSRYRWRSLDIKRQRIIDM